MTHLDTARGAGSAPEGELSRSNALIALALILGAHLLFFVCLNGNFAYDFDASVYGRIAHEIQTGDFEIAPHPFNQRFAVTIPTALSFHLFGVQAWSSTLWPFLCSVLAILIVFTVVNRSMGAKTAVFAALLLGTNLVQVKYSSRLLPDLVVATFMLAAASMLYLRRTSASPGRQRFHGALCALTLFVAALAKESVVWALPFFFCVMAADALRKRNLRWWSWFMLTGVAASTAYFAAYYAFTGNALYRLEAIEGTHNVGLGSFIGKSSDAYFRRLTYEPLLFLIEKPGFGLLLILSLPALVLLVRPSQIGRPGIRFWAAYFTVILLSFWFGTTSLSAYNPLPIAERFLVPLLAPLSILGAATITGLLLGEGRGKRLDLAVLSGAALVSAIVLWNATPMRSILYGLAALLSVAFGLHGHLRSQAAHRVAAIVKPVAVLLLVLAPTLHYALMGDPTESPEFLTEERLLVDRYLSPLREPTLVFTDQHSAFMLPFILSHEARETVHVIDWREAADAPGADRLRKLVYIHQLRLSSTGLNWGYEAPDFAREPPPNWKCIERVPLNKKNSILLFEIQGVDELVIGG